MPNPWNKTGQCNGHSYSLDHLDHYRRTLTLPDGSNQSVEFRFNYHCFTDENVRPNDHRHPFADPNFPHDPPRVFCPERWLLSRVMRTALVSEVDNARLRDIEGHQWVWRYQVGISAPYVMFFKIAPMPLNGTMVVNVMSAHVRPTLPGHKLPEQKFSHLVMKSRDTGQFQGRP